MDADEVIQVIERYRDLFGKDIFMNGACFVLARLLVSHYPGAEIYHDADHILTKINGRFYDINGEITGPIKHTPLAEYPGAVEYFGMQDLIIK